MTPLMAFTGPQVQRLTGLSDRMLRYWDETGVFSATFVDERPRRAYRRIYTFGDVVSLRTLALLRRQYGIQLDQLRRAGHYLIQYNDAPWASLRFGVQGKTLVFRDPESEELVAANPFGAGVIPIEITEIAQQTERDANTLRQRSASDIGQVKRHRHVAGNQWVVAGTRIPTSAIWSFHEDGYDTAAIIESYPDLTPADVERAIAHEASLRGLVAA